MLSKSLQSTNHHIGVKMTRKRVNHGIGLELEIPFNCFFCGDARVTSRMNRAWKK